MSFTAVLTLDTHEEKYYHQQQQYQYHPRQRIPQIHQHHHHQFSRNASRPYTVFVPSCKSLNPCTSKEEADWRRPRPIQLPPPTFNHDMPRHRKLKTPVSTDSAHTESSADETTAIARRIRGGNYVNPATHSDTSLRSSSRTRRHIEEPKQSWWKDTLQKYGSIELENNGSVARDHLALGMCFLARRSPLLFGCRTSLRLLTKERSFHAGHVLTFAVRRVERTFLAWLRTSLAFASIGIAVTQLFRLSTTVSQGKGVDDDSVVRLRGVGKPLGSTFLAIAILVLFIGFHRYFEAQHWIIRGKFPASRGSVFIVALIAVMLMVASLVVVLVVSPTSVER